jgi:hypothetical protein
VKGPCGEICRGFLFLKKSKMAVAIKGLKTKQSINIK